MINAVYLLSTATALMSQLVDEGLAQSIAHQASIKWALPDNAEEYYFPQLAPPTLPHRQAQ